MSTRPGEPRPWGTGRRSRPASARLPATWPTWLPAARQPKAAASDQPAPAAMASPLRANRSVAQSVIRRGHARPAGHPHGSFLPILARATTGTGTGCPDARSPLGTMPLSHSEEASYARDRLAVLPQYLMPKGLLHQPMAYWLAPSWATPPRASSSVSCASTGVNIDDAAARHPRLQDLQRVLHLPAQGRCLPLADADWICPVDGAISQFGRVEKTRSSGQGPLLQHHGAGGWRCRAGRALRGWPLRQPLPSPRITTASTCPSRARCAA